MSWNYRVIYKKDGNCNVYTIHEVYYNENGEIEYWTQEPIWPSGSTLQELEEDTQFMRRAFREPVLEEYMENGKKN